MTLSLFRNPLAFPCGVAPGFDPAHPASFNNFFSFVDNGSGFVGINPAGTISNGHGGTITNIIDSINGPSVKFATAYQSFPIPNVSVGSTMTLACIFNVTGFTSGTFVFSTSNNFGPGYYNNNAFFPTNSNYFTGSSLLGFSGPCFMALSGSNNGIQNGIILSLKTGKFVTFSATNSGFVSSSTGSTLYIGAQNSSFANYLPGSVSAVMASGSLLSMQQLLSWASDPWSFWYPEANEYPSDYYPMVGGIYASLISLSAGSSIFMASRGATTGLIAASALAQSRTQALARISGKILTAASSATSARGALGGFTGQIAIAARVQSIASSRGGLFGVIGLSAAVKTIAGARSSLAGAIIASGRSASATASRGAALGKIGVAAMAGTMAQARSSIVGKIAASGSAKAMATAGAGSGGVVNLFVAATAGFRVASRGAMNGVIAASGLARAATTSRSRMTGVIQAFGRAASVASSRAAIAGGIALAARSAAEVRALGRPNGTISMSGRSMTAGPASGAPIGALSLAAAARAVMRAIAWVGIGRQKIFSLAASTTQQPIQLRASEMTALNNGQTLVTAGDAFSLTFPILDASGVPSVYSAPVAAFAVSAWPFATNDQTPALKKTSPSNGVTIAQQTINGVMTWVATVSFVTADTESPGLMPGAHFYQLRVVDSGSGQTVATGTLLINPTIIP